MSLKEWAPGKRFDTEWRRYRNGGSSNARSFLE